MRIDELYPYWDDVHQDLLGTLEGLTEEQLEFRPRDCAYSIHQIVLDFAYQEQYLISHLVGGHAFDRPRAVDYADRASLVELLNATREVTAMVLDPYTTAGLRAVRTMPADPNNNQPETNVSVGWILWRTLEYEVFYYGQVKLRLEDSGKVKRQWE